MLHLSVVLSMFLLAPSIAASTVYPYLTPTVEVSSKFGVLEGKYYEAEIWFQGIKAYSK